MDAMRSLQSNPDVALGMKTRWRSRWARNPHYAGLPRVYPRLPPLGETRLLTPSLSKARSIHAGLKTLLSRDVWTNYREADFQRKDLRRRYLHLLLLHPTTREARDVGTHLWMQTSYAFITLYKQRLARPHHNNNNNTNNGGGGTFLADEERFWRALIALPAELMGGEGDEPPQPEDGMNHFGFPAVGAAVGQGAEDADGTEGGEGRSIDAAQARSVLSKALVYLGDIARYREQYCGAPPHGKGTNGNGGGEGKKPWEKGGAADYARARVLYFTAHALAPHEGMRRISWQFWRGGVCVLSFEPHFTYTRTHSHSYEGDPLASVAWYLRALCVRAPFETAGENLGGVLLRAAAHYRAQGRPHARKGALPHAGKGDTGKGIATKEDVWDWAAELERDLEEREREPPRVRVKRFKREVVLLHALWRERSAPPRHTLALSAHTVRAFARLVAVRALPEELIVRIGVLAQGAVWAGRMLAPAPAPLSVSASGAGGGKEKEKERGGEREKGRRRSRLPRVLLRIPWVRGKEGTSSLAGLRREMRLRGRNIVRGREAGQRASVSGTGWGTSAPASSARVEWGCSGPLIVCVEAGAEDAECMCGA
ncbi:hypothetical protein DFH09DRAFT_1457404 [Mycena vulgaris]|nr:hypothetical protein DFH09DRAFT_1457404 [Mycena vulgaris]